MFLSSKWFPLFNSRAINFRDDALCNCVFCELSHKYQTTLHNLSCLLMYKTFVDTHFWLFPICIFSHFFTSYNDFGVCRSPTFQWKIFMLTITLTYHFPTPRGEILILLCLSITFRISSLESFWPIAFKLELGWLTLSKGQR